MLLLSLLLFVRCLQLWEPRDLSPPPTCGFPQVEEDRGKQESLTNIADCYFNVIV